MSISVEQLCRCKKMKVWITEGQWTTNCPVCGRKYFGVYSARKCSIVGRRHPTQAQLRHAALERSKEEGE